MKKSLTFLLTNVLSFAAFATTAPVLPPIVPAMPSPVATLDISVPYGLSIVEFARQILQDVLKVDFVFSDDFINGTDRVGFSRSTLGKAGSESLLRDVLAERGYSLIRKPSYYYVTKTAPTKEEKPDETDFIYRLKYRDLNYISSMLLPLFPKGNFTFQRAQTNHNPASPAPGTAGANAGTNTPTTATVTPSAQQGKPVDNGTSAYSQMTRNDLDAFVFHGTQKDIDRLKGLLQQVDTPVPRAIVRAFILEVGTDNKDASAIGLVSSVLHSKLGVSLTGGAPLTNSLTFSSGSTSAVLSALSTDTRFNIKTAPSLYANTGTKAVLKVGSSIPTLGSIQTLSGGTTQQSVQYQDIGTILNITPTIADDDITVQVEQEISGAIETTTGVNNTPTLTKRTLSTTLSMSSGDWVLLGGLTSDSDTGTASRLPWFSFKLGNSTDKSRTDIVVLLQVERQ